MKTNFKNNSLSLWERKGPAVRREGEGTFIKQY
jgi:hypothetical protein